MADSGQARGRRRLSKQRDAELRRLLYLAAQANRRSKDSPFRRQDERERAKGLPTSAALGAVARKIARVCWSLVAHGTADDPDRVYKQPTTKAVAIHEFSDPGLLTPTIGSPRLHDGER